MAIAFRAVATAGLDGTATGNKTLTINKPTGTVDNDVMIAFVVSGILNSAPSITAPAGWTSLGHIIVNAGGSDYARAEAFWKTAASEGASYAFTVSGGDPHVALGAISAYSGVTLAPSPVDADAEQLDPAGGTSAVAPSVTAAGMEDMLVCCYGTVAAVNEATSSTPPTGMTERADLTRNRNDAGGYLALGIHASLNDQLLAAAGATGTRTATLSASRIYSGHSILLRSPAPAGGLHMVL